MKQGGGAQPPTGPSVLLILPDLSGGGAERTSLNIREQLRREGRDLRLALLEERGEYLGRVSRDDYLLPPGGLMRWIARRCPPDSPQRALAQVPLLMGLLRRESPEVVMSSMADVTVPLAMAFALMPGRRRKTRWIAREGNHTRAVMEEAFPNPRQRRWVERLIRWAYRSADACLAISQGVGRGLTEHYGVDPARIRIIGNPVDLAEVRAGARAPLEVDLPERFVVGVGRLAYQKGFDLLIEALAKLDDATLELVLVGNGPEEPALRAQAEQLGLGARTRFTGFVHCPSAVMARAEAFCLPSRWEGFGHVVVEAMASGCPVLVADCDFGPGEIVSHGENGYVVPPHNADALAAALSEMLANPEKTRSLAEHAAHRANDFSAESIAGAYWRLFVDSEAVG